jgi:hypothetical protein
MSGRQSELTDCNPTTMTGTTVCGVEWVWGCDGIDVEGEVAVSDDDDDDDGGSADANGNVGIVGIGSKPEAAVDDVTDEVGGAVEVVVVVEAPPGTKAGRKFAISRRGGMTGGKRYNLHQLILPVASILPAPKVGVRGELFKTGFEACLSEWKSRKFNKLSS